MLSTISIPAVTPTLLLICTRKGEIQNVSFSTSHLCIDMLRSTNLKNMSISMKIKTETEHFTFLLSICKTWAFHATVLGLVWSWPRTNCLPRPFCRVFMCGIYVRGTTLVSFGAWCRSVKCYATPIPIFPFIFELSLVKWWIVSLASVDCLFCALWPQNMRHSFRGRPTTRISMAPRKDDLTTPFIPKKSWKF